MFVSTLLSFSEPILSIIPTSTKKYSITTCNSCYIKYSCIIYMKAKSENSYNMQIEMFPLENKILQLYVKSFLWRKFNTSKEISLKPYFRYKLKQYQYFIYVDTNIRAKSIFALTGFAKFINVDPHSWAK